MVYTKFISGGKTLLKSNIFIYIVLCSIIGYTYRELFQTFFQQDEWLTMGYTFAGGIISELLRYTHLQLITGAGRPLGSLINNAIFYYFPFQTYLLVVFSLIFHSINTCLWYNITYTLTKKVFIGVISATFFAVSFVSSQAVTWFASIFTTLPATTCIFISLLYYIKFYKSQQNVFMLWAQLFAIIAYLFKESSMFLFIFIPILYYFDFRKKRDISEFWLLFMPSFIYLFLIISVRIHMIFFMGTQFNNFVSQSAHMWERLFFHAVLYPMVSFVQIFIPQIYMFRLAQYFQEMNYGTVQGFASSQLGVETIVSDFLSFILSIGCFLTVYVAIKFGSYYKKIIWFSVFFILLSFLPYIVLNKGSAYLDSRYFYNGVAGGGLLLGILLSILIRKTYTYFSKVKYIVLCILLIIYLLYTYKNIQLIQREIRKDILISQERKHFLQSLSTLYPDLPNNPVIYISGDHYGYYGMPELKIPFQQGPGYTFMTWYFKTGAIPASLLQDYYLWGVKDEGYRESDGKAFGYFWNKQSLINAIKKYKISKDQIIGLYYEHQSKKIIDITQELRQELYGIQ